MTAIGDRAFYDSESSILMASVTLPSTVTSIGQQAFWKCTELTSFVIPNSVTSIGSSAFDGCEGLTSVTIGNSVTSIGNSAFSGCRGLSSITIPSSVTSIGGYAFQNCSGLTSIKVESGNTVYDSRNDCNALIETATNKLIKGCANTVVPNSVTSIEQNAFYGFSGLTSVTIPNSVTSIESETFAYCSGLTSITIPDGVTSIGNRAFSGCSGLTSVTIPNGVTYIGEEAFSGCSGLTSVTIPNSVTRIRSSAFSRCAGLTSFTIPSSVTSIESETFSYCRGLTSVTIPNSVKSIGAEAFSGCSGLTSVISEIETPFSFGSSAFSDIASNCTLTVPAGTKEAYIAKGWTETVFKGGIIESSNVSSPNYSEAYNDGSSTDGWTSSVDGRFTPVILNEASAGNYFLSVDQSTRYNNGAVVTGTVLAGKVAAGQDFTLIFDLRLGNSNDQTPVTFEVKDAANADNIFSLAATNKKVATWTVNGNASQVVTLPGSDYNKAEDGSAILGIDWVTVIISRKGAMTFVTLVNSLTGEVILPQTLVEASATGGVGNIVFTSRRNYANFAIDNITLREWQTGDTPDVTYITFADANVKALCVANWDTDGDGELTEAEAAAVTSLGEVFRDNYSITSFDELQYFRGLTAIGDYAFAGCSGLTSVTIPNSVTSIGYCAFQNCSGLTSIKVNADNTSYDSRENCNAIIETSTNTLIVGCKNTVIPNSVTSIGDDAFFGCSGLTEVTIPNSVTSIGSSAFFGCSSLTSVTIPNSVTSIGNGAFAYCGYLTSIAVEEGNAKYDSRENCNAIIETSTNKLIAGCKNTVIPNSVTYIYNNAFYGCTGLTSVTIPNSVTTIANFAFCKCTGLTSVTIPQSVTAFGLKAFKDCSSLTSVTVEWETPITIGSSGLFSGSLANATLYVPYGCKAAYEAADYWNEFKEIVELPSPSPVITFADANVKALCVANWDTNGDGELTEAEAAAVTSLGGVFSNKGITSFEELQYFTGLTDIEGSAFSWCSGLTSVTIPNSVTSIGDYAFHNCSGLTSVTIPNGVTSIGELAFALCSGLTSVTIPNSVTSIGGWAFQHCSGLTSVTIPNSVTSIGSSAFSGCNDLTTIKVESGNTYDSRNNCNAIIETATNTLIAGCKNTVIPNSVTSVGACAFYLCSGLTSVTIPNSVTSIGESAFSDCSSLTSITIPGSVTSIGHMAFYGCSGLTSVTIPNSVTTIGESTFSDCSGLTSVTIPNSVTSIGGSAFYYCSGLTSVTIPNSVTSIGNQAFRDCSSLTSVTIPGSVTSIGDGAFFDCSSLISVIVEASTPVTISPYVFTNRANAVLYVPKGSKAAYEAANYWKGFKAIKEFPDPDVNQDGTVNVVDVVDIARFVVGTPRDVFVEFLADLNNSGEVNVADAVVLVNEIAGDTQFARQLRAPQQASSDELTLCSVDDSRLSLQLDGSERFAAFQFDLWLPSDVDVMQLSLNNERRQGHQLLYNKVGDGHYRVVAVSTSGSAFNGTSGELLGLTFDGFATDDVRMDNIHFVTTNGTDVLFGALGVTVTGGTTAIRSAASTSEERQPAYNLKGQRTEYPRKGLNIIGGKKVVVK